MRNGAVWVIDLGTQSLRGTGMDADGVRLRQWTYAVATGRDDVRCEQSPQEWRGCVHEILRSLAAEPEVATRLVGGLSRNTLLNQIKADVTGKTLRPAADFELTTLGAVAIAGCALGWFGSMREATSIVSRKGDCVRPEPGFEDFYRDRFAHYLELATQLSPLFRL